MPNILLSCSTSVVSCICLVTISATVQIVQASYSRCCSDHLLSIQYLTAVLIKCSCLSSFCCFQHTEQVVRQLSHIQHIMHFTFVCFAIGQFCFQCNDSTCGCFQCMPISQRNFEWLLQATKFNEQRWIITV